jgi:hypothetical protein
MRVGFPLLATGNPAAAAGDEPTSPLPCYPLRSSSQSQLVLRPPCALLPPTPHRAHLRINVSTPYTVLNCS